MKISDFLLIDPAPSEIPKNLSKLIWMTYDKFIVKPDSIIHGSYDLGIRLWWLNETDWIFFLNVLLNGIEF